MSGQRPSASTPGLDITCKPSVARRTNELLDGNTGRGVGGVGGLRPGEHNGPGLALNLDALAAAGCGEVSRTG